MPILIYKRGRRTEKPLELDLPYLSEEYSFTEETGFACEVTDADAKILLKENPHMFDAGDKTDLAGPDGSSGETMEDAVKHIKSLTRHDVLDEYAKSLNMPPFEAGMKIDEKQDAILKFVEAK